MPQKKKVNLVFYWCASIVNIRWQKLLLCLFHQKYASASGIEVFSPVSHTLFDPADIIQKVSLHWHFTYQKKSFHDRAFKWNNIIYFLSQINEVWKLMSLICLVLCLHKVIFCLLWLMYEKNGGRPPLSYQSFLKLAGQPSWAASPLSTTISSLPPVGDVGTCEISNVPTVQELGYEEIGQVWSCQVC